jgi:hypothetical protein
LRSSSTLTVLFALGALLLSLVLPTHAADQWQLADAPLRYKLDLQRKPTHPSAGYFVSLPDGGLLRGNKPATTVVTEDGKILPSYLLWQNVENGFALVFAKPEGEVKSVYAYIQPGAPARVWNPATGLTPSTILCTFPGSGHDNIATSQSLASLGRVEAGVHWAQNPGHPSAALSIGGDLTGRPRPAAFYQLSHLDAPVAGEYWVAPFVHTGQGEVRIDGQKIEPKKKSEKWGGIGAAVTLSKGLHRVEVLQTAPGTGPYASARDGLMYLTWRPPNEQIKNWEARSIKASEVAQSGACNLVAVESRDGAPLAAAKTNPSLTYWFENEEPLVILEFNALNMGYPADAKVSWTFPEGATIEGSRVKWLVSGFHDGKVKMTVKSGQTVSSSMVPYFGFSTQNTTLENARHREAFRDTLAEMLAVFPKNPDPVTTWGDSWWNNIFRTIEGGEGENLLSRLFADHFEAMRKRLAPAQMEILEDVFLDVTLRDHPEENFMWLKKFFASTSDITRQNDLRFREGELHMYYLNDRNKAEKLFTILSSERTPVAESAKIRLGDLALLAGDLNKATKFYADVQNRARAVRNTASVPTGALVSKQLLAGGTSATPLLSPKATPDMKGGALQEVSLSENVRTLTAGGFLLEARQTLDAWETEFPLSKISGDFILREAGIYMKMNDWKRARPMLEAYCREIDASSYLPDAVSALILCVQASKAAPGSIRGIVEKVKDRLKFHPIAGQLDNFLLTAGPALK